MYLPPSQQGPRILTLDIETAPLSSYHWGLWQENIGLEQVQLDWSILSFSAKWLHKPKVFFRSTGGRGADKTRDDAPLLKLLWQLLNKADVVVGQNIKKFDLPKINSRLIERGFQPYSPVKIVDTMLAAKKHFAFASNRLEWLAKKLAVTQKEKHREFPGFELWAECLKDNPRAWAVMEEYNRRDVLATEEVYLRMRPWIEGHPNVGAYFVDTETPLCPKCGSSELQRRGSALTQSGQYFRFQCRACGGWSRSRYTTNTISKRRGLLSN